MESKFSESHGLHWHKLYLRRRLKAYLTEEHKLEFDNNDKNALITAFINRVNLDPPSTFWYTPLRKFLTLGDVNVLGTATSRNRHSEELVLLDERSDPTGGVTSTRLWDSVGDPKPFSGGDPIPGYLDHPPIGEVGISRAVDLRELVRALRGQRVGNTADRRTIFFTDLSPTCALALAGTTKRRYVPLLRAFLQRHILFSSDFGTTLGFAFRLEFHIPYYALRRGLGIRDRRILDGKPLRASRPLPLPRNTVESTDYYHEAKISVLVTGPDEWVWTSYCGVDTFFGSEPESKTYLSGNRPTEPATAGAMDLKYPIWNPREFALWVLSARITQATKEWAALIDAFNDRMVTYEEDTLFEFLDDANLTRTKELTLTVSTLRRFRNTLAMILENWDVYEKREVRVFDLVGFDDLQPRWEGMLAEIRSNLDYLRSYHILLSQKLELFNSIRDGMVNASELKESAVATRQGNFITLLTRMTVFFLPISSSTGFFSMVIMPNTTEWKWFIIVLTCLTVATFIIASYNELRNVMGGRWTRIRQNRSLSERWKAGSERGSL